MSQGLPADAGVTGSTAIPVVPVPVKSITSGVGKAFKTGAELCAEYPGWIA